MMGHVLRPKHRCFCDNRSCSSLNVLYGNVEIERAEVDEEEHPRLCGVIGGLVMRGGKGENWRYPDY